MNVALRTILRSIDGRLACAAALVALCVAGSISTVSTAEAQAGTKTSRGETTVLFMCPHGAAKSVLASAYFQRVARERGLNVEVRSAGTDPDPQVAPAVASHLKANGYDVPVAKPRRVTANDMALADVVISIGCDFSEVPTPAGRLVRWDDVPGDFAQADEAIRKRVGELVDDLVRAAQPKKQ